MFQDLVQRGLTGVVYAASDEHQGLVQALTRYFPDATRQRCTVHYLRNVLSRISSETMKRNVAAALREPTRDRNAQAIRLSIEVRSRASRRSCETTELPALDPWELPSGAKVTDNEVRLLRAALPHDEMPVLHSLMLDHQYKLWVEEFARPTGMARRVSVYTSDGVLKGAFELSTTCDLLSADGNRIVVLTRRSNGIQVIQVFRLEQMAQGNVATRQ